MPSARIKCEYQTALNYISKINFFKFIRKPPKSSKNGGDKVYRPPYQASIAWLQATDKLRREKLIVPPAFLKISN
jgi:hypothetical protein